MDDSTLEKLQGLKHYNSKLDLWLDSVSSSPIEDLVGVSAEDRSTISALRSETSSLETRLQSLQDLVSSKQQEISALSKKTLVAKFTVPSSVSSSPLSETLRLVLAEEERARKNVVSSGRLPDLKRYLQTQKTLQDKERLLLSQLEQKENLLQRIRDDLARVDLSSVPSSARPRASLYKKWKQTLAEKNTYERDLRRGKYLSDHRESTRHQVELVLAEMERNAEILHLKQKSERYVSEIRSARSKITQIEGSMKQAADAMRKFKLEFEQLRVAIMLDKSIKSSRTVALARHAAALERAEGWYEECINMEKERIRNEETLKWEERLENARKHASDQLEKERSDMKERLHEIRDRLTRRYFDSFRPVLDEAVKNLEIEKEKTLQLKQDLSKKEQDLERCEREIEELQRLEGGDDVDVVEGGVDFATELKESMKELKKLWDELDVGVEEKVAFYSELDLVSPYNKRVHEMYEDVLKELQQGGA